MPKADLVLLHAPSVYDFRETSIMYGPVSDLVPSSPIFEMYPLGFTTIAEYMERHGLTVRIVNLAVLMLNRADFDVERTIQRMDPVAFGIDLHWLPHAHGAVEVARLCKKHHPETPVVFGGLSASYFHEELVSYPWVDYVVRGDSTEEPFTELIYALRRGGSVADIPNLTYKTAGGSVVVNDIDCVPETFDHVKLDYSFSMRSVIRDRDMIGSLPFKGWLSYPVSASLTCRGCTKGCPTCGGSAHAFRHHFGRSKVAFRDPELLVRDIGHIARHIPGPVFVLNDFRQAGDDYVREFITGLKRIDFRNPIGFEFFSPPAEEFYAFLDENLNDYSVEVSAESHDDAVRAAFGKPYTWEALCESVEAAFRNNCQRFDLYFMTGIPTQTARSVLDTVPAVQELYDRVGGDSRLLAFIGPMAPFLDPGSKVFDDPAAYGYRLRAKTLEEHRQLLLEPSWKHILNYEPDGMTRDEMVDATYEAALGINRIKGSIGIVSAKTAAETEERIAQARTAMRRIDEIMERPAEERQPLLADFKREVDRLNESTVCEKTELNWPSSANWRHVVYNALLWVRVNLETVFPRLRKVDPRFMEPGR
ncbi:MAG: TIGR04190 family B12-binding domain/radical SAM domain protein [Anaerosomatales bacterium]|nr:TIGR04190 family B12-binding domain/radical SAM domain protein [Anaerosomatales bacterium]